MLIAMLTEDEIASFFDSSIRTKLLKTRCVISNKTHKQINIRIRQLFNIFVKFDPNVITKIIHANDRELNHLLHNLRDVFICDNTELVSFGSMYGKEQIALFEAP